MYLYLKKYKKYKNKYQLLKKQLISAKDTLLNGGAQGTLLNGGTQYTLLNGGECASLPTPEEEDFTSQNLLDLCPEERITIQNKCYDVRGLYEWIITKKKK